MHIQTFQTFLAIIETGSLIRASDRLNVTQSTVTARLKALEDDLGQKLFIRRKSGAELTSAGFKFQRYAQLMSDLWRQAREETSLPPEVDSICNIGCHFDLWPNLGRNMFDILRTDFPATALSTWPGEQTDIDRWLGTGLVDAAICYAPKVHENQTIAALREDVLVLVSTSQRELMRWDPGYIYVDSGEEFRIKHAETYPDGDTPTVIFGCAVWALEYLIQTGGSAYLPERLVTRHIENKLLYRVPDAATFKRRSYLITNDDAAKDWPWMSEMVEKLAHYPHNNRNFDAATTSGMR